MKVRGRGLLVAAAMLVVASGCGEGDSGSSDEKAAAPNSSPAKPETATVNVTMTDVPPLDVLFNASAGSCTSVNIAQLIDDSIGEDANPNAQPDPVQLTLRDAKGTIVGTQTLDKVGGSFAKATGCTWTLTFDDVPASDFYEATVATADEEYTGIGQASGGAVLVEVPM